MKELDHALYIVNVLDEQEMAGHAYTMVEQLYELCHAKLKRLDYDTFLKDKAQLIQAGVILQEGRRVYRRRTLSYENAAAEFLSETLRNNFTGPVEIAEVLTVRGTTLTPEQRDAVIMGLTHRLSLILGGAGTGKTTLIHALVKHQPPNRDCVLCAPTGKAARNLRNRTGLGARTVHGALGKVPDQNFLGHVLWGFTDLVVVDEASMLTLEMLAGLLNKVSKHAHMVLVGDPAQLQSVGAGNVLKDLIELGVPSVILHTTHRQDKEAAALSYNVHHFDQCHSVADLKFDDSFQLLTNLDDRDTLAEVLDEGSRQYLHKEDVQILSPFCSKGILSVKKLNDRLQELVNPATKINTSEEFPKCPARAGDRVMVTENDYDHNVSNGDIGEFAFGELPYDGPVVGLRCPDGRQVWWTCKGEDKPHLSLAYAVTVHKSQGSEWDTIIIPLSNSFSVMMSRNLIYTAISRAKKRVLLIGSPEALEKALQQEALPRRSMLVRKTRLAMRDAA